MSKKVYTLKLRPAGEDRLIEMPGGEDMTARQIEDMLVIRMDNYHLSPALRQNLHEVARQTGKFIFLLPKGDFELLVIEGVPGDDQT